MKFYLHSLFCLKSFCSHLSVMHYSATIILPYHLTSFRLPTVNSQYCLLHSTDLHPIQHALHHCIQHCCSFPSFPDGPSRCATLCLEPFRISHWCFDRHWKNILINIHLQAFIDELLSVIFISVLGWAFSFPYGS